MIQAILLILIIILAIDTLKPLVQTMEISENTSSQRRSSRDVRLTQRGASFSEELSLKETLRISKGKEVKDNKETDIEIIEEETEGGELKNDMDTVSNGRVSDGGEEYEYCVCRSTTDDGSLMIECNQCPEWFHPRCIGLEQLT